MLGAAVLVGCNNEIDNPNVGPDGKPILPEGESTSATFNVKFASPSTYAGETTEGAQGKESAINDVALFIYKVDDLQSPEAMAYLAGGVYTTDGKITVKCKSGDKLIYVAANIGGNKLINATGLGTTNSNAGNGYLGADWIGTGTTFPILNAQVWAINGGIRIDTVAGFTTAKADDLIKALNGNGVPGDGVLTNFNDGNNAGYLMTNWGNKDSYTDPQDANKTAGATYQSTCKFTLIPGILAGESRGKDPKPSGDADAADYNAFLINVQRALAKVTVAAISTTVLNNAGAATNAGKFVPKTKWALGNINKSEFPFMLSAGQLIQSTRYNEVESFVKDPSWVKKLDNSRFEGTGESYFAQNMTVMNTLNAIEGAANQEFNVGGSTALYHALATENNHRSYANQYSSFVVFGGQYQPAEYITSVNEFKTSTKGTVFPTEWNAATPAQTTNPATLQNTDTMYYLVNEKLFFLGSLALKQYVCYVLEQNDGGLIDPATDDTALAYINDVLLLTKDKDQALLQAYFRGYCFYRIWIQNQEELKNLSNKYLVRRNHIYRISVDKIVGPGIGDPNDIIDPDPEDWEPIEEADTYVTATIKILDWHVVAQGNDIDLN